MPINLKEIKQKDTVKIAGALVTACRVSPNNRTHILYLAKEKVQKLSMEDQIEVYNIIKESMDYYGETLNELENPANGHHQATIKIFKENYSAAKTALDFIYSNISDVAKLLIEVNF